MTEIIIEQSNSLSQNWSLPILFIVLIIILAIFIIVQVFTFFYKSTHNEFSSDEIDELVETLNMLKVEKESYLPFYETPEWDYVDILQEENDIADLDKVIKILNQINKKEEKK